LRLSIKKWHAMGDSPRFQVVEGHEFKPKEKVFVIDPNGFDIWEAVITTVRGGKYSVHYPEYPQDDQEIEDTSRILVDTRANRRIFHTQEAQRQVELSEASEESEPSSDDSDSDAADFADDDSGGEWTSRRGGKKGNAEKVKPRPKGSRVSPRRRR
jgi:hypothetical protein